MLRHADHGEAGDVDAVDLAVLDLPPDDARALASFGSLSNQRGHGT